MFGEFAITLEASTIRPGPVTLVVHNAGHLTHGFEMKIEGGHGSGGDRKKIETRTFQSGETLRVEVDLPAGTYEVECFVADHASLGMKTTLEVRPDAPLVTAAPGGSPGTVRIVQFAFVAASIDVVAGGSVTWTNEDPEPHTVTADGGAFDSRQLEPGGRFSVVLATPGDYAYRCEIHPTMVGTIHVP
jgi:plastocyanin